MGFFFFLNDTFKQSRVVDLFYSQLKKNSVGLLTDVIIYNKSGDDDDDNNYNNNDNNNSLSLRCCSSSNN